MSPHGGHRLILASSSPRRRELLAGTGVVFEVPVPEVDETPLDDEAPLAYVERIARAKAMAVPFGEDEVVLAADTTVVAGDRHLRQARSTRTTRGAC